MKLLNFQASLIISILLFFSPTKIIALEIAKSDKDKLGLESEVSELEYFALEEQLFSVKVSVASLFLEEDLVVGNSVSGISPKEWKNYFIILIILVTSIIDRS